MKLIDVFKYAIGDKVYLLQWASDTKICECCGQEYDTEPEPIGVVKGDIVARKFIEDTDSEHWESSGVFYRVCTERRDGKPIWFRNVRQSDLFDTKEQAEQELRKLQNEN